MQMVQTPKSQNDWIKFTIVDCSNFDKQCSDAHFVPFLFHYYCNHPNKTANDLFCFTLGMVFCFQNCSSD